MLYQTANPHGGDIYSKNITLDFSASVNPYGTPPSVLDAITSSLRNIGHYPDPGCQELIRSIGTYESVSPEFILCGNGAAELIYAFCISEKPQKALIPIPAFSEYENALHLNGCRIIHHRMSPSQGFRPDDSILEQIAETEPDTIFLCNPGNPSGSLIDFRLLEKIAELCSKLCMRMFIDECFLELTGNGQSLAPLLADHPGIFILKSLTKAYAIPGVRIGYGLSSDIDLLKRMSHAVQPWNVSLIAQEAGVAAFKEKDHLKKSVVRICLEREWLTMELRAFDFYVCPSDANYILFNAPEGLDSALEKKGIAIRNCSNFQGLDTGWYRTAVRMHEENELLIRTIREIVQGGS